MTRQALLEAFQPLVDLKESDGLTVHVETVENILANSPGRDAAEKLRTFIRQAYTNWGIEYVLLGGDIATVPYRSAHGRCANQDGVLPTDLYFACLDGTWNRNNDARWGEPTDGDDGGDVDLLAEVYVDRAPVDTPAQASVFVAKVIASETTGSLRPFAALCAGEFLGSPGAHGGAALDPLLPPLGNGSFGVAWLDDRPQDAAVWTAAEGLAALNRAPQLVFHHGHADETTVMRCSASSLGTLVNPTPFLLYSAGCDAGAFDNTFWSDCVGEALMQQSTGGAFAAILNSREGWFDARDPQRYSGEFQRRFLDELLTAGNTAPGRAHQLAKQAMVGLVETAGDMPYRWCYFDLVFFGDPHAPISTPTVAAIDGLPTPGSPYVALRWNSLSNRTYSVHRATNLATAAFACIGSNVVATPPLNTYTDAAPAGAQAFYRIDADGR